MTRHLHLVADPPQPPPWLGRSPTGVELERMPLDRFHAAVDRLERDTVGWRCYQKVVASRQSRSSSLRSI